MGLSRGSAPNRGLASGTWNSVSVPAEPQSSVPRLFTPV